MQITAIVNGDDTFTFDLGNGEKVTATRAEIKDAMRSKGMLLRPPECAESPPGAWTFDPGVFIKPAEIETRLSETFQMEPPNEPWWPLLPEPDDRNRAERRAAHGGTKKGHRPKEWV